MNIAAYSEKYYVRPDDVAQLENSALQDFLAAHNISSQPCLDFGCGTGHWLKVLLDLGAIVTGVDVSEKCIQYCIQQYPEASLLCFDGTRLPFSDSIFHSVLMSWVFQELAEDHTVVCTLTELRRIIRHGGHLIIAGNVYPDNRQLARETPFGDLFYNTDQPPLLRFISDNSLKEIAAPYGFEQYQYCRVGDSFIESLRAI